MTAARSRHAALSGSQAKAPGFAGGYLLCLALIGVYALSPETLRQALAPWRPILLLEWILVWVFGYSWFEKGREPAMRRAVSPATGV